MNCNECKNLIRELEDLKEVLTSNEAQLHLSSCAACRASLHYEEKLRRGFDSIADEQPPAFMASKIMAIQKEQLANARPPESIFSLLRTLVSSFTFKVALAAGLTGFCAALLIMRPDNIARQEIQPAVNRAAVPAEIESAATAPEGSVTNQAAQAPAPATTAVKRQELLMARAAKEDHIPGAISFSLDQESKRDEADSVAASGNSDKARSKRFQEEDLPQLAMAMEAEAGYSKAMSPEVEERPALPMSAPAMSKSAEGADLMTMKETDEAADPRAVEILELITTNNIELPEGFIRIEDLAMRGLISSTQLKKLTPPAGSGWFLQNSGGNKTLKLKKR